MRFYVYNDEVALFDWLAKIKCIQNTEGVGRELHLHISSQKISDDDLLNLMGIFKRYRFSNPEQLRKFMNEENKKLSE